MIIAELGCIVNLGFIGMDGRGGLGVVRHEPGDAPREGLPLFLISRAYHRYYASPASQGRGGIPVLSIEPSQTHRITNHIVPFTLAPHRDG